VVVSVDVESKLDKSAMEAKLVESGREKAFLCAE
jgi:hypothetical protein